MTFTHEIIRYFVPETGLEKLVGYIWRNRKVNKRVSSQASPYHTMLVVVHKDNVRMLPDVLYAQLVGEMTLCLAQSHLSIFFCGAHFISIVV